MRGHGRCFISVFVLCREKLVQGHTDKRDRAGPIPAPSPRSAPCDPLGSRSTACGVFSYAEGTLSQNHPCEGCKMQILAWDTRFKSPGKLCMGKRSVTLSQVTWICLSPHWAQGVPLIDSKVVWRPLHDSLQLGIPRTSWS